MGKFVPERNKTDFEAEAIHTYIADMAMQLSALADKIGNETLRQHLSQAASTAKSPYENDQART